MNPRILTTFLLLLAVSATACNDGAPFARAYPIENRAQAIGGVAALTDLGDYIIENDKIRIGIPQQGNSTGPGVFGGGIMDADVQRPQARFRNGKGKDQISELFPIANLAIPAVCEQDANKHQDFCSYPRGARPSITILCDGSGPCARGSRRRPAAPWPA